MKSSKKKQAIRQVVMPDIVDPDTQMIPPDDESDAVDALLHRMGHHDTYESTGGLRRGGEVDEYIDKHDLSLVMEDLQFGHDLRL